LSTCASPAATCSLLATACTRRPSFWCFPSARGCAARPCHFPCVSANPPGALTQVFGFTLDQNIGEFVLSHENIKIPASGKIYSFNEGNYAMWTPGLKKYMDSLKVGGEKADGKPYSARYIGSLVGDFHRTMLYGGIYGYPGDSKNVNGKLRLL